MSEEDLPEGWALCSLESLVDDGPRNGISPPTSAAGRGSPSLKLSATTSGEMILSPETTKRLDEDVAPGSHAWLAPGDLLVQRANSLAHIGAAAIYDGPSNTYVYPDLMMRLRVADEMRRRYLWHYLNATAARAYFREHATGTAGNMPKINGAILRALPVPLPPHGQLGEIVAKLDALRARSRRAKDALDAVPALLDRLRQSILAAAFRGDLTADWREQNPDMEPASELLKRIRIERRKRWEEAELAKLTAKGKRPKDDAWKAKYVEPEPVDETDLPELPEGWCWDSGEGVTIADIVYGIVQPGPEVAGGVRYVRGLDIQDGRILVDQLHRTSEAIAHRYARASIRAGDVLLGIIRATKVAIVPAGLDGSNITQGTARFRPSLAVGPNFLAGWLDSPFAQDWLHAHYRGIDMPGLNLADVRRVPVPLCSQAEQAVLITRLRAALDGWGRLREAATANARALPALDASVLAAAFRGELLDRQSDALPTVYEARP